MEGLLDGVGWGKWRRRGIATERVEDNQRYSARAEDWKTREPALAAWMDDYSDDDDDDDNELSVALCCRLLSA